MSEKGEEKPNLVLNSDAIWQMLNDSASILSDEGKVLLLLLLSNLQKLCQFFDSITLPLFFKTNTVV